MINFKFFFMDRMSFLTFIFYFDDIVFSFYLVSLFW